MCSIADGLNTCSQPPECHAISRAAGDVLYTPEQVCRLLQLHCHAPRPVLVDLARILREVKGGFFCAALPDSVNVSDPSGQLKATGNICKILPSSVMVPLGDVQGLSRLHGDLSSAFIPCR